jgi:hypothetical protein
VRVPRRYYGLGNYIDRLWPIKPIAEAPKHAKTLHDWTHQAIVQILFCPPCICEGCDMGLIQTCGGGMPLVVCCAGECACACECECECECDVARVALTHDE